MAWPHVARVAYTVLKCMLRLIGIKLMSLYRGPEKFVRPPQDTSLLLHMPPEVLLYIADKLPVHTQHLFSQTSIGLRLFFFSYYPSQYSSKQFSRTERIEYCHALARDRPEVWVCSNCARLHQVSHHDIPRTVSEGFTQGCSFKGLLHYLSGDFCRDGSTVFYVHEAHVQLALKYLRLRRRLDYSQRAHFSTLFLERTRLLCGTLFGGLGEGVYYHIETTILGGRFMLYIEYTQYRSGVGLAPWQLAVLKTCCTHQNDPNQTIVMIPGGFDGSLVQGADELCGSCPYCATDVALKTGRTSMLTAVGIWKDLGPEVPSTDPQWFGENRRNFRRKGEYGRVWRAHHRAALLAMDPAAAAMDRRYFGDVGE